MSDAELAEYHWQHCDDELGEEVEFEIAKPLRATMSFRLPAQEADAIRKAAAAAGTSLSEWIRWAAMRAARDTDVPPPRHAAISRARELLLQAEHELDTLVGGDPDLGRHMEPDRKIGAPGAGGTGVTNFQPGTGRPTGGSETNGGF